MLSRTLMLCALCLLLVAGTVDAQATVDVYLNENRMDLDPPARVVGGTTYVPLRSAAEGLGGYVQWDPASRVANVTIRNETLTFRATDAIFVRGHMLFPLRELRDIRGVDVAWHGTQRRVDVRYDERRLAGRTVAILVEEGFHDQELDVPRQRLEEAGARTVLVGSEAGAVYEDYRGQEFRVTADIAARDARAEQFDALLIPGGHAPAIMRESEEMIRLVREFDEAQKPIAAICHGPWVLVSAGVVEGRAMTCVSGIADDLREAGAEYRDEPVVVDAHLITSRVPGDLDQFSDAIVEALERQGRERN